MRLTLTREPADGNAVRGFITPIRIPTLENLQYIIPPGTYTLTVTYSPRFKRMMPLVCNVPKIVYSLSPSGWRSALNGRSEETRVPIRAGERLGIRFHPGSKPEHSKGCILLRTTAEVNHLTALIQKESCTLTIRNVGD